MIEPLDDAWLRRAAEHQARLTMPTGALGRILDLGRQLSAIQETLKPRADPAAVVLMAADHGIADEGVSAYPQEVTSQMVANFVSGGAAINVLARRQSVQVVVVNMGLKNAIPGLPGSHANLITDTAVAAGTANFLRGPAMTADQAAAAEKAGRHVVANLASQNTRVLALGEMGIGNSTSASALAAALLGLPAEAVTGRGTGVDEAGLRRKIDVVERALDLHFPGRLGPVNPSQALQAVGGFEIAGLAAAAREAAARRMLVLLDGFISSVAGLVAVRQDANVKDYLVASHRSPEPGQRRVLDALQLEPLLDLGLRLGEGSGAALALNLVQCAADIMRDMATFDSAGVSDRHNQDDLEN